MKETAEKYAEKTCPIVTLSTTNLIQTDLASKMGPMMKN